MAIVSGGAAIYKVVFDVRQAGKDDEDKENTRQDNTKSDNSEDVIAEIVSHSGIQDKTVKRTTVNEPERTIIAPSTSTECGRKLRSSDKDKGKGKA